MLDRLIRLERLLGDISRFAAKAMHTRRTGAEVATALEQVATMAAWALRAEQPAPPLPATSELAGSLREFAARLRECEANSLVVCAGLQSQTDLLHGGEEFNVYAARLHAEHQSSAAASGREAALVEQAASVLESKYDTLRP